MDDKRSEPPSKPLHKAYALINDNKTKQELASFYHAALFSPVESTLLRAIKRNHFTSWPDLTSDLITKHLPKSIATAKGHTKLQRQGIKSTKPVSITPDTEEMPKQEVDNKRTNNMFVTVYTHQDLEKSYSDQTGRFPARSSRGNQYVFVLYNYDTNSIHSRGLKDRQSQKIVDAWEAIFTLLKTNGHEPKLHIMDNECSSLMKDTFKKYNIKYQLVPPYIHRRNAAERAIQTWKNHFISGLASCDPNFPIREWDRLLEQGEITLNLLRSSRRFPNLSAYASIYGNFDYNTTPIAPPGTRTMVYESPVQRTSFGPHGVEVWYIGPAMEHYRCFKCYVPSTASVRCSDTVEWFPKTTVFPEIKTEDYLRQTASDMLDILQNKERKLPSLSYGTTIYNAYIQIAQILKRATSHPRETKLTITQEQHPKESKAKDSTKHSRVAPATNSVRPQTHSKTVTKEPRVGDPGTPSAEQNPSVRKETSKHGCRNITASSDAPIPSKPAHPKPASDIHGPIHKPFPLDPRTPRSARSQYITRYGRAVKYLAQSALHHHIALHIHNSITGKKETLATLRAGPSKNIWDKSLANEIGRLAQGVGKRRKVDEKIIGTNTILFITKDQVPSGRKVTYANFVCDYRPLKTEQYRVRCTTGGDKLEYPGDASSPTISLIDTKLHLNSVISDAKTGARYLCIDIRNFYLGTPMKYFQYMRIHRKDLPSEILEEYDLTFDSKGYVYCEIRKGMYGLREAGALAHEQLVNHLDRFGYYPTKCTPGLWRHKTRRTTFTLCVDDFGVKYYTREDAEHLIQALNSRYETTVDWEGSKYLGLTLHWNYDKQFVDISMPGYITKALQKFQHTEPKHPQHAPYAWQKPTLGKHIQMPTTRPTATPLNAAETRRIQEIVGTLLFYARGTDPTMLVALNEIGTQQATPTQHTKQHTNRLLDYAASHKDATIRYYGSDMVLRVTSDAAYLVLPQARSRAGGHYFLSTKSHRDSPNPTPNGPVHTLCQTIRNVVASAAEAEIAALYLNAREAAPMRVALEEMGHPQPPTPLETDNTTAHGIITSTIRQKLSKAFDMRWHWLRDRVRQKQFEVFWSKGKLNLADYFTKHHPAWHHKKMRYKFLARITKE